MTNRIPKKKGKMILRIFLILLLAFLAFQGITAAVGIHRAKKIYLANHTQITAKDITIKEYCGTYGGCTVAMLDQKGGAYLFWIVEYTVAGVPFLYSSSQQLFAFQDGAMLPLDEAYEAGWLNGLELRMIWVSHQWGLLKNVVKESIGLQK